MNHVRFHSWCPPAAAFHVADSMGVYLQVECGGWTWVGDGNPQDEWLKKESDRIVKEYGNHPSFCLMAYGNEPGGDNQRSYLNDLVVHWKQTDGRRLYTSAAGWPKVKDADYFNTDHPRIGGIGRIENILNVYTPRTDYDFRERIEKDMPVVSHEVGQWCVYPDFKEIDKYTGVLKAKNFEIFRETLNEKGLGDMAEKYLYASGRLQTLCYKMDIEAALRTPGFAGFQLLDLHDFPGQGTALVGVLNPFWESKGYVEDKEFSTFCNQTVPLARMAKLVWNNNEQLTADIEFAHFGEKPLNDVTVGWDIETKDGDVVKSGSFRTDLPIGNLIEVNDGYSDFQWKDLAVNCNAMIMDDFSHDFRPLVYIIDDWFKNRKLGVLFEGKIGKGNLMVCSIDLDTDLDNRLSAVQFKQSILEYMASDKFKPQQEIDLQVLQSMFLIEK